ncbi:hypothetical protein JI721_09750 [Alicyclobacillus cycloheptanicus]|uniref:DUF4367 domain-containing protein n=1 Tax=Alicyclobacillus cycloheptanicus TaxID=1457 RepID=A0ABT9XJC5_9BACL|nr:hypothetical protein [Alicyclobacillus cycloheptanicus]MDQ0190307.1 hypothetical protein [Alicyclobacillus cycloheptanicus]WDM00046.1 hypothetical protein JI721_09750 [Alicyclobacillus cycloheptanicus]
MQKRKSIVGSGTLLSITLFSITLLAGCTPAAMSAEPSQHATDAGVAASLPQSIAGPPVTLNVPRRIHNIPLMRAVRQNQSIRIYSNAHWHGKVITVYYVPAQNVLHDGNHYDLRSAVNVQKIGQTTVRSDGTWQLTWHIGNTKVPLHKGWFFLAKSDIDEISLIHVNTFN